MSARGNDCLVELASLAAVGSVSGEAGTSWLTPAEASRLQAMGSALRQRQFLAGHWLVRQLAATAYCGEPSQWRWETTDDPRPRLVHEQGMQACASLSHSGDQVAAAVALQPIGLDLELPLRARDLVALARYLFAPDEVDAVLAASDDEARTRIYYTYWTLKEARGKRGGEGLQPSQARRVAAIACDAGAAEAWHWALPGQGSLALAASPGVQVNVPGLAPGIARTPSGISIVSGLSCACSWAW
jgi:4'-phosphopantetheinyl transferase